jgi:tRNA A37 methylthiotransferase MiaB
MIGVAGCVAQAEGEEIMPAASRWSTWSSARRPITAAEMMEAPAGA